MWRHGDARRRESLGPDRRRLACSSVRLPSEVGLARYVRIRRGVDGPAEGALAHERCLGRIDEGTPEVTRRRHRDALFRDEAVVANGRVIEEEPPPVTENSWCP